MNYRAVAYLEGRPGAAMGFPPNPPRDYPYPGPSRPARSYSGVQSCGPRSRTRDRILVACCLGIPGRACTKVTCPGCLPTARVGGRCTRPPPSTSPRYGSGYEAPSHDWPPQPGGCGPPGSPTDAVTDVRGLRRVDHPGDLQLDVRRQHVEQPEPLAEHHRDLVDLQ